MKSERRHGNYSTISILPSITLDARLENLIEFHYLEPYKTMYQIA